MHGVRVDKWLWAARFFKTRSQASKACDLGRIESHGGALKPAHEVRAGELLRIRNAGGEYEVEVLALSETRGPAAVAQTLYRETEASREARRLLAEQRKLMPPPEADWEQGRPTKRDRRQIERLRGR
jgi:ribosome-associated heat shock protein Hsp15